MTDPIEPTSSFLDQQLCFALYSTSRAFTKVYSKYLCDLGLTYPQYLAMLVLWETDGLNVKEIADRLNLEGATATPLIQRLVRLGLVYKKRSQDDERCQDVFVSESGAALREKAMEIPNKLGKLLNLSEEQAGKLLAETKTLRATLQAAI
ncbi:MarR family transcriptional regulator [uncultured Roseobacter sp.]|uniref:MarR family winged helix-turn-helix transcriptional regulator n=1 Tax=uncultured Roseobacter sp. TaxID=114847 RepID=UPI00263410BC|nr:MarR family transcriptional regulator [uncultured Roseobacter sp.]